MVAAVAVGTVVLRVGIICTRENRGGGRGVKEKREEEERGAAGAEG